MRWQPEVLAALDHAADQDTDDKELEGVAELREDAADLEAV